MTKKLNLGVIGIDHGHIFDMLDELYTTHLDKIKILNYQLKKVIVYIIPGYQDKSIKFPF